VLTQLTAAPKLAMRCVDVAGLGNVTALPSSNVTMSLLLDLIGGTSNARSSSREQASVALRFLNAWVSSPRIRIEHLIGQNDCVDL
jgi:hypothetical protein